jgi:hypothetical protein
MQWEITNNRALMGLSVTRTAVYAFSGFFQLGGIVFSIVTGGMDV